VTTWFPGKGSDQNQYARVHCFDISGRPSNSRFFLSYIDENPAQRCAGFAGTVCPAGFLLADGPFTPIVYQPSPSSPPIVLDDRLYPATGDQGNAEGRLSHVSRRGTGRYAATVWGRFYGVQVTSYGEGATRCKLASFPDDPTLGDSFDVACFAASGEPTDSAFAIRDVAD
jgi:hypothetical protein